MSEIFDITRPRTFNPSFSEGRVAIAFALCVFLPIVAISLLGRQYAGILGAVIPIDLTNFDAIRKMSYSFLHPSNHGDSWLPMRHALEVLNGPDHDRLYETLFLGAQVRFQYPPSSLLPLELLSALGVSASSALNALNALVFVLNACASGALGWLLFQGKRKEGWALPPASAVAASAFCASFAFYPLVRAQVLGQIQIWIDLLFTLAVLGWVLQRRLLAGFLIGLACTIKPQMGLLLLWGLLWRDWKFVSGILGAALPILLLSVSHYGIHNHLAYLDILSFLSRHGESFFANNSINGILNWYLSPNDSLRWYDNTLTPFNPTVYAGTMVASMVALSVICAMPILRRGRAPGLSDLGIAAICTIVGSPVAWEHHYGILLPLYLVALHAVFSFPASGRRHIAMIMLVLSWVMVADFIPFAGLLAHTPFRIAQAYCLFGALSLLAVLVGMKASRQGAARG